MLDSRGATISISTMSTKQSSVLRYLLTTHYRVTSAMSEIEHRPLRKIRVGMGIIEGIESKRINHVNGADKTSALSSSTSRTSLNWSQRRAEA